MIGPLIAAGASLAGGYMAKQSQDDANDIARQNAANNIQLQKEFAENAIKWKVDDATRAGIHPLYALGASTTSFSPVSVGVSGANPLASAISDAGSHIGRGVSAATAEPTKVAAALGNQAIISGDLDIENKRLNNQLLRSRLVQQSQPGSAPAPPLTFPGDYTPGKIGHLGTGEFTHPEDKPEKNPPLMANNKRWLTSPEWSPMKAFEDRYGDDGPASWIIPWMIGAADVQHNMGPVASWPAQMLRSTYRAVKEDIFNEMSNAKRFFTGPVGGGSVSPRRPRPRGYY